MTTHNFTQQLVFLRWINNRLEDPLIEAEIRDRIKGADVKMRQHLKNLPNPTTNKQDAWELLWTYMDVQGVSSKNLERATEDVNVLVETYADFIKLKKDLNVHLKVLGLPTFGSDTED